MNIFDTIEETDGHLYETLAEKDISYFSILFLLCILTAPDNKVSVHFCKPVPRPIMHHIIIIGLVPWGGDMV